MPDIPDTEIERLVAMHPLPDGVEDCIMTREELADAMNVALPTISDWINKGMPVKTVGGQGKAYELQLSHCWAWRQAWKQAEDVRSEQVRRAQAAMRLALVGGKDGNSIEALNPKDRKEILEVQLLHEKFERDRNQLLRRDDVAETFEIVFGIIRDTLNSAPDRAEQHAAIPPKAVDALVEVVDGLLEACRRQIDQFWAEHPLKDAKEKRSLFDA